ncbi:MAG TPA: DUF493 domain-containing protein [Gammaproteobacteria bacterium]|nr:DUF493 domain-containing protein [Gammaproteobacteria bacterium]
MNQADDNKTAMQFPCAFPIKAMGRAKDTMADTVLEIVQRHAPEADARALKTQPSSNGKFVSVTVTIDAQSREQLDAIYLDLNDSDQVLMTL